MVIAEIVCLALLGCSPPGEGVYPQQDLSGVPIQGVPLETAMAELARPEASFISEFGARVPKRIPPEAVSLAMIVEETDSVRSIPDQLAVDTGGAPSLRSRAIVVNPGSNDLEGNLLCLHNGQQTSCAPEAHYYEAALPAQSLAAMPISIEPTTGDRIDLLFLLPGESVRPSPSSLHNVLYVDEVRDPWPRPEGLDRHGEVFGGCGFATLVTDLDPKDSFRPIGTLDRGEELHLLVQTCPGDSPHMGLVAISDRQRILTAPGWPDSIELDGSVGALPVPAELMTSGRELQFALLPHGVEESRSWLTHSVIIPQD